MVARYTPVVVQAQDYYAFGMLMPQRSYTAPGAGYRYGFNGKENDNEVKGDGNQQDYGERIHDTRLGRFLSTDPLTKSYPMLTPFQYASNSPIYNLDIDGLEGSGYIVAEFYNDPGGTVMNGVRWINRNLNPLFIACNHGEKIVTGSDFDGNPVDSRGRIGAVADAGVDVMMYITFARFFKTSTKPDPMQAEIKQQSKAMSQSEKSPNQKAAIESEKSVTKTSQAPKDYHQSTIKSINRNAKGINNRGNAFESFGNMPGSRYATMEHVGKLDGGFFPYIDYIFEKHAVQLKTFFPESPNSFNLGYMQKAVDKLVGILKEGRVSGKSHSFMVESAELDILMPQKYMDKTKYKSLWEKVNNLIQYGENNGVKVNVESDLKPR